MSISLRGGLKNMHIHANQICSIGSAQTSKFHINIVTTINLSRSQ